MNRNLNKIYQSVKRGKFKLKVFNKENSSHLLIKGDCENVAEYIPNNSIDLIITDPPYNRGLDYGKEFNDRKPWPKYYDWLRDKLAYIPRVISPRGSLYLISYPEINARLLLYLEDELKLKFRRWITWHYPSNIGHSSRNFTRSQRSILFFTKSKKEYTFNRNFLIQPYKNPTAPVIKKRLKQGYKGRTAYDLLKISDLEELSTGLMDVVEINLLKNNSPERLRNLNSKFRTMSKEDLKKFDHPCQLPIKLLELFINVSSNKNDIVLDPFSGTFTTSSAAAKLDRNSIGIDKNGKFFNFGIKRLKT